MSQLVGLDCLSILSILTYMKITRFEDAIAWQKGQQLAVWVYQTFGHAKDFVSGTKFVGLPFLSRTILQKASTEAVIAIFSNFCTSHAAQTAK